MPDAQQKSISLAGSLAWNTVLNELTRAREEMSRIKPTLPYYERKAFEQCEDTLFGGEDNMLDDLTNSGADIVAVAANLFLGYVEGAMRYAESQGGGGGPKNGWGKKFRSAPEHPLERKFRSAPEHPLERKRDEDDRKFMCRCFIMACTMMKRRSIPIHRGFRR